MIYAPDYYPAFHCIASDCRHSCCIGWEIDIDADTRAAYAAVEGEFGARLADAIEDNNDGAHFRLCPNERCPMLRDDGLCDLILTLGEDSLCQICSDHPRFRHFYDGCTEVGLGLCCEAAAALVLGREHPMQLIAIEDDGDDVRLDDTDRALLALRETLLTLAGDTSLPIDARMTALLAQLEAAPDKRSMAEWREIYRRLERLDGAWDAALDCIQDRASETIDAAWDAPFARLLEYFLFRHLPDARDDGRLIERVKFAVLSLRIVRAIFAGGALTMARLCDIARMYSSEIEYDDDNVTALLEHLTQADYTDE